MKRASEHPFPYGWPGRVLYMEQYGETVEQIKGRDNLRLAVDRAIAGVSIILAAWPGQHRTDLFLIDQPERLAAALGMAVSA